MTFPEGKEKASELSSLQAAPESAGGVSSALHPASESQPSKEAMDSPAKKQHKNRVKLAANFSLAPVTNL